MVGCRKRFNALAGFAGSLAPVGFAKRWYPARFGWVRGIVAGSLAPVGFAKRWQPAGFGRAGGVAVLVAWAVVAGVPAAVAGQPKAPEVSPKGYIEMPPSTDGSYTLGSSTGSRRSWGRPELIRFLVFAAREWKRRHPDKPRFRIGDMSRPDGAKFPPHKTHKDGLTLDLVTRPKNVCHVRYPDQDLTTELAQLLYELGARQILYNGKKTIDAVSVCKPHKNHDDHFHIVIDPRRVPKDLGPLLLASAEAKAGRTIGPKGFGEPGPRKHKLRSISRKGEGKKKTPPPAAKGTAPGRQGLRVAWRYLGEARRFQVSYRVRVERVSQGGAAYDSGVLKKRQTWHVVPERFADGETVRWKVDITGSDDSAQSSGWQEVHVDLLPPAVQPVAPAAGATAGRKPKFQWTYKDPSPQATARIEVRKALRRRGVALPPLEGEATELESKKVFPKGRFAWRVIATDAAGNESATAWTEFAVE